MKYTKKFKELSKFDSSTAGGKGASLGEMICSGIPVPDGFVVIAPSFDLFVKNNKIDKAISNILKAVDAGDVKSVENASFEIRKIIMANEIPDEVEKEVFRQFKNLKTSFVAVRSSATAEDGASAAWAGQLESYLNTNEKELLLNVKKCWASLFTPRAIFYRIEQKFENKKVSVAVVVQKMVNSEFSGIAFSIHPVLNDERQIAIDAGYGLGESIVGGLVTPNSYCVAKNSFCILDKIHFVQERKLVRNSRGGNTWKKTNNKERKQYTLLDIQIKTLAKIITKIENHYGFACDIEWAFESGKFYIVQSRPVTTSKHKNETPFEQLNWYYWGCWKNTILWASPWYKIKKTKIAEQLGLKNLISGNSIFTDGHFFTLQNDFDLVKPQIIESLEGKSDWLKRYFKLCDFYTNKFVRLKSNKNFTEFLLSLYEIFTLSLLSRYVEVNLEQYAKRLCVDLNYPYQKLTSFMVLKKETPSSEYNKAIIDNIDNDKILAKFSWIGANFYTGEPTLTLEKIKLDKKEQKITQNSSLIIKNIDRRLMRCVGVGSEISFIRTNLAESFNLVSYDYYEDLKKLAKKNNLKLKDIMKLIPEEVVSLYKKGKMPIDFKARKNKFGIIAKNNEMKIINGKELKTVTDKFSYLYKPSKSLNEITGLSAFNGIAKGIARVILGAKDIGRVAEGEIIVAPETTPDYILGMKKAVAFVTNQGGITSHAAIVAREMQKPCVIATKIATEVIKDGDLIEVNANQGLIKIL